MSRQRQLAHAPLREALIDIQLTRPLDVSFAEGLANRIIPGCERKNEIRQFSMNISVANPTTSGSTEELMGWRFESADGARIVQIRRNGIGYSIVKEYTEWADIKSATHQVWDLYQQWAGEISVNRIAVRYINVLDLPIGTDLNVYFTTAPQVPVGLPQTLAYFLQRIIVPFDPGISAIITQTTEPSVLPTTRVILDIDVFAQRVFDGNSLELWAFFDRLREVKNAVFFSSVTERALEAYQ